MNASITDSPWSWHAGYGLNAALYFPCRLNRLQLCHCSWSRGNDCSESKNWLCVWHSKENDCCQITSTARKTWWFLFVLCVMLFGNKFMITVLRILRLNFESVSRTLNMGRLCTCIQHFQPLRGAIMILKIRPNLEFLAYTCETIHWWHGRDTVHSLSHTFNFDDVISEGVWVWECHKFQNHSYYV